MTKKRPPMPTHLELIGGRFDGRRFALQHTPAEIAAHAAGRPVQGELRIYGPEGPAVVHDIRTGAARFKLHTDPNPVKWWHVYGGESPAGHYMTFTLGGSTTPPAETPPVIHGQDPLFDGLVAMHRLYSFDHEPSEVEVDRIRPEQYQDEEPE